MSKKIAESVSAIVNDLKGLSAEERVRAVRAALTIYGDQGDPGIQADKSKGTGESPGGNSGSAGGEAETHGISTGGAAWMKKNGISRARIDEVFDIADGKAKLILGEPIGKTIREQVLNTYVLTGIASLIGKGEASFSDEDARGNCTNLGCYDKTNHAKYLKEFGNRVTGSKTAGWKLTAPGLKAAADLITPATKDVK
jgi:hypothetical protein